jgi:hypothetical protein
MLSLSALGAACAFAGWVGSSRTGRTSTGELWLVLGIVGLVLEGSGIATWLLMGTRRVRSRQAELLGPLLSRHEPDAHAVVAATDGTELLSTPTMTRYHRPGCELVSGKDAVPATLRKHLAAGRQACGVCRP